MALKNLINEGHFNPPVLIFVQSKERAEELLVELKSQTHIKVDSIHAGKNQKDRVSVYENFRLGKLWALICTDLFARGLDFKGVK